jgi:hypothetical protein
MAKSFKKAERVPFISPFGIANWPYLSKADERFPTKDGKPLFKSGIVFDDADLKEFSKFLQKTGEELHGDTPFVLPIVEFYTDKTKKELQGKGVRVKSVRKPLIFDAKKQPIPADKVIGGGSIIRVAGIIQPYESTEKVRVDGKLETTKVFGLTLYVDQVQVRKLVAGRSQEAVFGEDEGGFEYVAEEGSAFDNDDATAF